VYQFQLPLGGAGAGKKPALSPPRRLWFSAEKQAVDFFFRRERNEVQSKCAQKTSACAVSDAFENPRFRVGASCPGFGSHYGVGLQAPDKIKSLAPSGYSIGSSKVTSGYEHRRGFRAVADSSATVACAPPYRKPGLFETPTRIIS